MGVILDNVTSGGAAMLCTQNPLQARMVNFDLQTIPSQHLMSIRER